MKKLFALVLAMMLLMSATAALAEGSLVVYSPHDADPLNAGIALFQAAYPDIDVQVIAAGTGELCQRIVAESENPQITYGQHVSRNEFGIDGGIFIAPDSSKVAFYRKDESKVSSFPLLDITTRTGSLKEIKYPMAGMDSENVQLGVYDVATGTTVYMKVDEFGYDQYLTNISWRPDASQVLIQVLDRSQKHMKLNKKLKLLRHKPMQKNIKLNKKPQVLKLRPKQKHTTLSNPVSPKQKQLK